jgi:hypothetical protein
MILDHSGNYMRRELLSANIINYGFTDCQPSKYVNALTFQLPMLKI